MSTPSIIAIARQMRDYADATPWQPGMHLKPYRSGLSGGLTITLYCAVDLYVLCLERQSVMPPDMEVQVISNAFRVPNTAHRVNVPSSNDWPGRVTFRWTQPRFEQLEIFAPTEGN